jgi:ATP-binding protein involved in chromosome partitioning
MVLSNIKNIIPIASGKGGVGKSTVSANLALAMAKTGARVGLMDADVYGPSIPTILGISDSPTVKDNRILPVEKYGLKVVSMGFFVPPNEAVIWRGPMLHKMVQDFLGAVEWGELDYLIVDLPPGTGDIQISLCQTISLTGAVVVSTPQQVAWRVAQKAIMLFDKLNAPVLGVIENMSHHVCSSCGHREEIFGFGGARKAADTLGLAFLGEIPLMTAVRLTADEGYPVVISQPDHPSSKAFVEIAGRLTQEVERQIQSHGHRTLPLKVGPAGQPKIEIQWNDGHQSVYSARDLRLACPCAVCVHEVTGQKLLKPEAIPADIHAVEIQTIGCYALQIFWSDGHNTGIYGYDFLRKIA